VPYTLFFFFFFACDQGYRQTSSPEKLSADWPTTMQIVRLIDQNYMQSKYATYPHLLVSEVLLVVVDCNFAFNLVSCLKCAVY
jgi:hypothetical protein